MYIGDTDTLCVAGRNLLVIGSQCKSLAGLSCLPDVGEKLYEAMTDPNEGVASRPWTFPGSDQPDGRRGEEGNGNGVRAGRKR